MAKENNKIQFIQGNEAIAQAGLDAGMGFYSSYPITPASEVMHYLAKKENSDFRFLQGEDEIASINLCVGASLAGKKSMTATSGPGFSLMQETIGFAQINRIPLVIVNSQRVGPSTGMPTLPSQGDILQTQHGSHGDYFQLVFYPNSVQELYEYTIQSFNASEELQAPVILLSDGMLSHMYESLDIEKIKSKIKLFQRKEKALGKGNLHVTGLLSENNIPKTKDSKYYKKWFEKYEKEFFERSSKYRFYEYIENKNSNVLLVAFGNVSRVIYEFKKDYGIFRPITLFPVLDKELKEISKSYEKVIVIEMNNGQYYGELKKVLGEKVKGIRILGGEVSFEEIKKELENDKKRK